MNVFGAKGETSRHLLMNCNMIKVTRARSLCRHQISYEDVPRQNYLQILDAFGVGGLRLGVLS